MEIGAKAQLIEIVQKSFDGYYDKSTWEKFGGIWKELSESEQRQMLITSDENYELEAVAKGLKNELTWEEFTAGMVRE